jgi:hypothetical protein
MENIIERIAHHADIDTRRAMGFPPRKLNINFEIPQWTRSWEPLWGGSVTFRKGNAFVWRSMEFNMYVYRCLKTGTKYQFTAC